MKPTVSTILPNGILVETLYDPEKHTTIFCVGNQDSWRKESILDSPEGKIVPIPAHNNLVKNGVILLPSDVEEYESEEKLIENIRSFIHKYVDISSHFEKIACYYVLFSWVYDTFNELPYIRVRGDYGSGKTRFLQTVGSLCYKPIFSSGASTISPLFRILDSFRGTLIIDESDFRASDEKAELVKILNNGSSKGFPVLRSEVSGSNEINPKSYTVFGPKLVASRGCFEDQALESRFLTEEMGQSRLRKDVPINLPVEHHKEAERLRNQLLLFRLRNRHKINLEEKLVDWNIEPRLNQIFVPLLSVIHDEKVRADLQALAKQLNQELIAERGLDTEAQVLEVIGDMMNAETDRLAIKDITDWFVDRFGEEYDRKITLRWIGYIIRKKLNLKTQKSQGTYVIPLSEELKLLRLFEKYGIKSGEVGQ